MFQLISPRFWIGKAGRNRTLVLWFWRPSDFQLSLRPRILAANVGFDPTPTGSKPVVLPLHQFAMELPGGFEPPTCRLQDGCSAAELRQHLPIFTATDVSPQMLPTLGPWGIEVEKGEERNAL